MGMQLSTVVRGSDLAMGGFDTRSAMPSINLTVCVPELPSGTSHSIVTA